MDIITRKLCRRQREICNVNNIFLTTKQEGSIMPLACFSTKYTGSLLSLNCIQNERILLSNILDVGCSKSESVT